MTKTPFPINWLSITNALQNKEQPGEIPAFFLGGNMEINYNQNNLDALNILTAILQVLDFEATMQQSSNDDIIQEIHMQNTEYLRRIESQNLKILKQNEKLLNLFFSDNG